MNIVHDTAAVADADDAKEGEVRGELFLIRRTVEDWTVDGTYTYHSRKYPMELNRNQERNIYKTVEGS